MTGERMKQSAAAIALAAVAFSALADHYRVIACDVSQDETLGGKRRRRRVLEQRDDPGRRSVEILDRGGIEAVAAEVSDESGPAKVRRSWGLRTRSRPPLCM